MMIKLRDHNTLILVILCAFCIHHALCEEQTTASDETSDTDSQSIESIHIPSVTMRLNYFTAQSQRDLPFDFR